MVEELTTYRKLLIRDFLCYEYERIFFVCYVTQKSSNPTIITQEIHDMATQIINRWIDATALRNIQLSLHRIDNVIDEWTEHNQYYYQGFARTIIKEFFFNYAGYMSTPLELDTT